jgi:hypothetical protein
MRIELAFAVWTLGLCGACETALDCGPGSHREADECVASLDPICASGTELKNGSCVPVAGGGGQECGPGTHSVDNKCVPDVIVEGNASRMTDLEVTAPDAIAQFKDKIRDGIANGSNLFLIGAHVPFETGVRFYGGMGKLTDLGDGSYTFIPAGHQFPGDSVSDPEESPFDSKATSSGTTFSTEPFILTMFIIGNRPIKLVDAVITNATREKQNNDFYIVKSGEITAVLTPENGNKVFLAETSGTITEALGDTLKVPPDVDRDKDGKKESWLFKMNFTATEMVWLYPDPE